MKLSVKLLSGLTLIALIAVVVVGFSRSVSINGPPLVGDSSMAILTTDGVIASDLSVGVVGDTSVSIAPQFGTFLSVDEGSALAGVSLSGVQNYVTYGNPSDSAYASNIGTTVNTNIADMIIATTTRSSMTWLTVTAITVLAALAIAGILNSESFSLQDALSGLKVTSWFTSLTRNGPKWIATVTGWTSRKIEGSFVNEAWSSATA